MFREPQGAEGVFLYTVEVTDPERHTVHVTCLAWGVREKIRLIYLPRASDPEDVIPDGVRASIDSLDVPVRQKNLDYVISLPKLVTREHPLVFEYDCVMHHIHPDCVRGPNDQYISYLDELFGIFLAEWLFLQPDGERNVVAARFELPEGWKEVTPWESEGGWYTLSKPGGLNINLGECVVGIGPFDTEQRRIGSTVVTVAMVGDLEILKSRRVRVRPGFISPIPKSKLADFVFGLFEYYYRVVGGCSIPRYTVFFHPLTTDGKFVNCSAWATGTAHGYDASLEWIAHEIFHWWNRVVPAPGLWVGEIWTNFFAWDGIVKTSFIQREEFLKRLPVQYENHRKDAAYPNRLEEGYKYHGELFPYALDGKLKAVTGGKSGLSSVVKLLYKQFGPQKGQWRGRSFDNKDIEDAVRAVGGDRSAQFLREHVFGNKPLDLPELTTVAFRPDHLKDRVTTSVNLFIRPPEYLLRDRKSAAIVVRLSQSRLDRSKLETLITPSLKADVAIGDFENGIEVVFTVAVKEAENGWTANLELLPIRGIQYFIWDSTGSDFSGELHPIPCYIEESN